MNFSSYFVLSSLVVMGIVAHAYVAHEQFYPAVVYLSTDKMCLAVMYNFAFALFLLFGKILLRIFIGTLRDLEVEQLVDSGRGFLADTILFLVFYAPTIDNQEVGTVYLIQYICCVIFMKVFHLVTQIRVSHMFEVGVPRLLVNVKLVALMCLLLSFDVVACQYFYSVAAASSTFFTWILFEALTMATVVVVSICKYSVHMVDLRLDNGWPGKSVFLFYIDLVHDVVSMTLFLVFMLTFFVQNPSRLPIYMMADVIQVARKLAQRLRSFRRYRRISLNMELRFPDATDEEIEQNEHCVICRESLFEGSKPKKLPCGHIFHIDCLRSWLVMQQVCPTCRAEIPADGPLHAAPDVAASAAHAAADRQAAVDAVAAGQVPQQPPIFGAPDAAAAAAEHVPPAGTTFQPHAAVAPAAAGPAASAASAMGTAASSMGTSSAASPGVGVSSAAPSAASHATAPAATAKPASTTLPTSFSGGSSYAAPVPAQAPASAPPQYGAHVAAHGAPAPLGMPDLAGLEAVSASLNAAYSSVAVPPVGELVEALQRAEEVSKFLRQQTDFWMEQVRQIQGTHAAQQRPQSFSLDGSLGRAASAPVAPISEEASASAVNSLAELRRIQQEKYERTRSSDSFGKVE